jgi:hypothetical protein
MEFNSPREYVDAFIDVCKEVKDLDKEFIEILRELLYEKCEESFRQYMYGKREDYTINESEFDDAFDRAGEIYFEEIINGMIDKGVFEGVVNEEGEVLYRLTEFGKQQVINISK